MKKLLSKNRLIFLGIILILIAVATAVFFGISHFNPDNTETENSIQDVADGNLYNSSALPSTSSYADIENAILIDDILQEHLNIFLSTFSEIKLQSFSEKTSEDKLIGFGYLYNKMNRYQDTVEKADITINGTYCVEKINYKYIAQTVQKYFGVSLTDKNFQSHPFYKDGYIYAESYDLTNDITFSIAQNIKAVGEQLYEVDFAIYDVSSENFNLTMQKMSPSDAASKDLKKIASGTARISAENLSDQETYILKEYNVK